MRIGSPHSGMSARSITFLLTLLPALVFLASVSCAAEKASVSGNVSYNGTPVTAMVLANGKYMFTGGGEGLFNLTDVSFDTNGKITLYAFCSGRAPYKTILSAGVNDLEIEMLKDANGKQLVVTIESISESSTEPGWNDISGTIENQNGTPVTAMVLANGQYMFTNNPVGEFELTVPLDANDQITLYGFCSGMMPYKEIVDGEVKPPEFTTFSSVAGDICYEDGKPVIRMFSTSWCPHCIWVGDTFDAVAETYVEEGLIVAHHWDLDKGDDLLTPEVETSVPNSEWDVFYQFSPQTYVPAFVFGCKYYRIGNGYESQNDLTAEAAEFEAVIEALLDED